MAESESDEFESRDLKIPYTATSHTEMLNEPATLLPIAPPSVQPSLPGPRPNTTPAFQILPQIRTALSNPSPLNANAFRHLLQSYPIRQFPELLTNIIKYGANIGYVNGNHRTKTQIPNHTSAV